jgi:hypothetical protein
MNVLRCCGLVLHPSGGAAPGLTTAENAHVSPEGDLFYGNEAAAERVTFLSPPACR